MLLNRSLSSVGKVIALTLALGISLTAAATPLVSEDWETGTDHGWGIAEFWGLDVTLLNGEGYNGSQGVLKLNIPDNQADSEWLDHLFPAQNGPVYLQFYVRLSDNWKWSPVENKIIYLNWPGDQADVWRVNISFKSWYSSIKNRRYDPNGTEYFSKPGELSINVLHPESAYKEAYLQNAGSYATSPYVIGPGRWYCIDCMVLPNTPGSSNGALKMWIDRNLVLDHANVNVRGTSTIGLRRVKVAPYWNQVDPPTTHGYLNVWYDNITVDTQPIGPGTPDETPPTAKIAVSE